MSTMAQVTIERVGAKNARVKFHPQKSATILAALEMVYGPGHLLSADGSRITFDEHMAAGDYIYQVTGFAAGHTERLRSAENEENAAEGTAYVPGKRYAQLTGAMAALQRLRDAGVALAVVSNFDTRLRPVLEGLDMARLFDAIIVSAEMEQLAQAVLDVDTTATCIKLSPQLPRTHLPPAFQKNVMVRDCYRAVMTRILTASGLADNHASGSTGNQARTPADKGVGFVLAGTPGIGKSVMALYLLCILAKERQKVLYEYVDSVFGRTLMFWDFTDPSDIEVDYWAERSFGHAFRLTEYILRDARTWYLIDGPAPKAQYNPHLRVIVLSTADWRDFFKFSKSHVQEVWLPVWSREELETCRKELYPSVEKGVMEARYTDFGGVVRHVLDDPNCKFTDLLRDVGMSTAKALMHLEITKGMCANVYSLAHIKVTDNFDFQGFELGSDRIMEEVRSRKSVFD